MMGTTEQLERVLRQKLVPYPPLFHSTGVT